MSDAAASHRLAYGGYCLWTAQRNPTWKVNRPRIAILAAGDTIVVAVWIAYTAI